MKTHTTPRIAVRLARIASVLLLAICMLGATVMMSGTASAGEADHAVDAADAHHGNLAVREHALATGVEKRRPLYPATRFDEGDRVYAWIAVENPDAASHVSLVWHLDGDERWRIQLDVGHTSGAWRTWAYKTMRAGDAGAWTVDVVAPDGTVLETIAFDVHSAPDTPSAPDTTLGAHDVEVDAYGAIGAVETGC